MGSTGATKGMTGGTSSAVASRYKDGTQDVASAYTMRDAYFKNAATLISTINKADGGRFDILDRGTGGDSGTIAYMDSLADDDTVYEVSYQRSYANPDNPSEIQIYGFKVYEDGEWFR